MPSLDKIGRVVSRKTNVSLSCGTQWPTLAQWCLNPCRSWWITRIRTHKSQIQQREILVGLLLKRDVGITNHFRNLLIIYNFTSNKYIVKTQTDNQLSPFSSTCYHGFWQIQYILYQWYNMPSFPVFFSLLLLINLCIEILENSSVWKLQVFYEGWNMRPIPRTEHPDWF